MELFYYPTMSGECVYQSHFGEKLSEFPRQFGHIKRQAYVLNTGNLVASISVGEVQQPILLIRKALPINDLYIFSFEIRKKQIYIEQPKQKEEKHIEIKSCYFSSATAEAQLSLKSGDKHQVIEIRISRAYLLHILQDVEPEGHSNWLNILKRNEHFLEKVNLSLDELSLLESISNLLLNAYEGTKLNALQLEHKIADFVLAFIEGLFKKKFASEEDSEQIDYKKIKEVQKLIQEDLLNKYKIPELAAHCNMCSTKFKQLFKRFTGSSLSEFYNHTRMEQALTWLHHHPQGNISELAYSLGYKSLSHFTTAFKSHFGYTPTSFWKSIDLDNVHSEVRISRTA